MMRCPTCRAGNITLKTGTARCWKCKRVLWIVKVSK